MMQRQKFTRPEASVPLMIEMPINHFSKIHSSKEGFAQLEIEPKGIQKKMSRASTQSTTVQCNGKSIKIHAIQTGTVAVKRSHRSHPTAHFLTPIKISLDKHFTEFMPIWSWLIEHPEGNIVIDTGENAKVMNPDYFKPAGKVIANYSKKNFRFNITKENEIGFQLRHLNIKNDSIKNVVLTHLHIDHTDGIKDFKNVEFIVNEQEFKRPSGHIPELVPNWFKPKTVQYKNDFITVFNQAYPLTNREDLLLIPTKGHTNNHASVLFKTDDFDILFAGDVCYHQEQLVNKKLAGINADYKESRKTYEKISKYAKQRQLILLPSHDSNSAIRLKERQFL
ncbi:N-acyl homoserine lactonase family protein [Cyclobacterium sp. 1_MG-2023]|uniref:N-acyl homoserine lactonase family protein n=1 Tax=Cyclobacterium sp. 1_MG-2023 TaxID=3062681 RepID=UPI0026E28279|nr:N-acyl homoserine lactonase family protein [Cyclobacterium sp. 1_MG-2023]MDO6438589.1 N-acyl homoserine lactonase family protein [Cyclobacterium sp. 1_MG-2023]